MTPERKLTWLIWVLCISVLQCSESIKWALSLNYGLLSLSATSVSAYASTPLLVSHELPWQNGSRLPPGCDRVRFWSFCLASGSRYVMDSNQSTPISNRQGAWPATQPAASQSAVHARAPQWQELDPKAVPTFDSIISVLAPCCFKEPSLSPISPIEATFLGAMQEQRYCLPRQRRKRSACTLSRFSA